MHFSVRPQAADAKLTAQSLLTYLANQQIESRLGCAILNRMIHVGRPESYGVKKSTDKETIFENDTFDRLHATTPIFSP